MYKLFNLTRGTKQGSLSLEGFCERSFGEIESRAPLSGSGGIFTPLIKRIHKECWWTEESPEKSEPGKIGKTLKTSSVNVDL